MGLKQWSLRLKCLSRMSTQQGNCICKFRLLKLKIRSQLRVNFGASGDFFQEPPMEIKGVSTHANPVVAIKLKGVFRCKSVPMRSNKKGDAQDIQSVFPPAKKGDRSDGRLDRPVRNASRQVGKIRQRSQPANAKAIRSIKPIKESQASQGIQAAQAVCSQESPRPRFCIRSQG